ncbi:hypothetical protein [Streptomyces sp. NPDC051994]|uniref:hypothetical protein n=1 Tax=unclassified Streptomyces TaxID=2593676 RepID=UPI003427DF78
MPSIIPAPIPDRVAVMIGSCIPKRVLRAEVAAQAAFERFRLCRAPLTAVAREYAIAELAAANKILGAYNPGLIVTLGGAR